VNEYTEIDIGGYLQMTVFARLLRHREIETLFDWTGVTGKEM